MKDVRDGKGVAEVEDVKDVKDVQDVKDAQDVTRCETICGHMWQYVDICGHM